MTVKEIRKYIDRLNNGKGQESIFTRSIGENVEVAKVWSKQPREDDDNLNRSCSYRFFFIKDELNKYVGAVLDMTNDLHWYVVPGSRKKGLLTKALKESILPYLFYDDREIQRITIDEYAIGEKNYLNSKGVAMKLGFKSVNCIESEFELANEDFDWSSENLKEVNSPMDNIRFEELRKRANYASRILSKISDELLMAFDDDDDLEEIAKEVWRYTWKIEDIKREYSRAKDY